MENKKIAIAVIAGVIVLAVIYIAFNSFSNPQNTGPVARSQPGNRTINESKTIQDFLLQPVIEELKQLITDCDTNLENAVRVEGTVNGKKIVFEKPVNCKKNNSGAAGIGGIAGISNGSSAGSPQTGSNQLTETITGEIEITENPDGSEDWDFNDFIVKEGKYHPVGA